MDISGKAEKRGGKMALFSKESKEEKQAQKLQALMEKYGLENVNDPQTAKALKEIGITLAASNAISFGAGLQGKTEDVAKIDCLRAIIEQNFIIIRQLDKLCK